MWDQINLNFFWTFYFSEKSLLGGLPMCLIRSHIHTEWSSVCFQIQPAWASLCHVQEGRDDLWRSFLEGEWRGAEQSRKTHRPWTGEIRRAPCHVGIAKGCFEKRVAGRGRCKVSKSDIEPFLLSLQVSVWTPLSAEACSLFVLPRNSHSREDAVLSAAYSI